MPGPPMKTFSCERCEARVFFENVSCCACEAQLGFVPSELAMASFDTDDQGRLTRLSGAQPTQIRRCANHAAPADCNWMISADDENPLCISCRTTRVVPALDKPRNQTYWRRIEAAKRQLAYSLKSWNLPFPSTTEDPVDGVAFDLLEQTDPSKRVLTGHDNGVITLNIAEADDAIREQVRTQMHEPYRTLLGHFRHEIGHYYWDRLIRGTGWIGQFRELFGDERLDYAVALKKHYASHLPAWQERFVSAYASSHPWEDWAECWAHYMHLQDGLETAASWGLQLDFAVPGRTPVRAQVIAADEAELQAKVVRHWLPVSQFINAMSRSLGGRDSYPFVMANPVLNKLAFIHQVIGAGVRGDVPMNFGSAPPAPPAPPALPIGSPP
jgi:hypothetical protein